MLRGRSSWDSFLPRHGGLGAAFRVSPCGDQEKGADMDRKGRMIKGILGAGLCIGLGWLSLGLAADSRNDRAVPSPDPIGLSLLFQNGAMASLTLVGDAPRY